jgi:hypothetical protein
MMLVMLHLSLLRWKLHLEMMTGPKPLLSPTLESGLAVLLMVSSRNQQLDKPKRLLLRHT